MDVFRAVNMEGLKSENDSNQNDETVEVYVDVNNVLALKNEAENDKEPNQVGNPSGFKCAHCKRSFRYKSVMCKHEKICRAAAASTSIGSRMGIRMKTDSAGDGYRCGNCFKSFKHITILAKHTKHCCMKLSSLPPPRGCAAYRCDKCKKPFKYRSVLWNHQKNCPAKHSSLSYFTCPDCSRIYKYPGAFFTHRKYDCGKNPQVHCPVCGKGFTTSKKLIMHTRILHPETIVKK
ncbi:hypothetical protein LSTR_LSTR000987 [Laodelphax striatellus]|uniref:C2H2-type domain-containing protein n=1 Tax=Laodelphax striatellus TaxID=195883 RepID=A0A482X1L1_LAOST|nr:hypothetical protein LSTR_LSTR000987 [Laodelphax striatellus]